MARKKWTKGQWKVVFLRHHPKAPAYEIQIRTHNDLETLAVMAKYGTNGGAPFDPIRTANAHRIVDCVNACCDFNNPEAEIKKLKDDAKFAERVRLDLKQICKSNYDTHGLDYTSILGHRLQKLNEKCERLEQVLNAANLKFQSADHEEGMDIIRAAVLTETVSVSGDKK